MNKDKLAFPFVLQKENRTFRSDGLTKLEYVAAQAPNKIPDWFIYEKEYEPIIPPKSWEEYPESDPFKEEMRQWHQGFKEEDTSEEIEFYIIAWDNYYYKIRERKIEEEADRYFQWRIYYSEELLKRLESK